MRTVLGMRLTARRKTRARRPSPRPMRTRPGPPRANQRAPARPRGGEGEIISLTSLKLKAAHKRHLRRGQAGPRPGEAGAEGDYNGGRRQGGGTFRGRMYLDDTRQPPRGTRRFPGERGSEPQDAPRLARSAENTRDRHPAALAAEGLGTAVAPGGRQGAPRGVDAATGTSGTFAGREARGAAALQGGGVGGFRRGDPPPPGQHSAASRVGGRERRSRPPVALTSRRLAAPRLGIRLHRRCARRKPGHTIRCRPGSPEPAGSGSRFPSDTCTTPEAKAQSEGAERVVTWERGGAGPRSPQRPHMVPDPAGRRPGRRGGLGPARSGHAGLGHGSRRGGADVSALHDSTRSLRACPGSGSPGGRRVGGRSGPAGSPASGPPAPLAKRAFLPEAPTRRRRRGGPGRAPQPRPDPGPRPRASRRRAGTRPTRPASLPWRAGAPARSAPGERPGQGPAPHPVPSRAPCPWEPRVDTAGEWGRSCREAGDAPPFHHVPAAALQTALPTPPIPVAPLCPHRASGEGVGTGVHCGRTLTSHRDSTQPGQAGDPSCHFLTEQLR